jgi:hypothetical protein
MQVNLDAVAGGTDPARDSSSAHGILKVQNDPALHVRMCLLQDFAQWTHPISSDWTHLAWVTGGAAGDDFYASFLREASFLALTPR